MIKDGKIWLADNDNGNNILISPSVMNRHGIISGATGTGKTITLKVLAETFSELGVPVFIADIKGDVSSLAKQGITGEDMNKRIEKFRLSENGFEFTSYPVTIWDLFGEKGIRVRTTISEMGPLLLSRILGLNDLQRDILSVVFKIADDNGLILIDTKDLKAMLAYVDSHSSDFQADYGKISSASVGVITRALVSLESSGADIFFGEPALNVMDFINISMGLGNINILESSKLVNDGRLYSTFLLWMLSELYENLPEVGDLEKPKFVFFFDEAHLLFNDISSALLEKIEQVVRLVRSKGVGVYFCTQNPKDIPDSVSAQLANKVQHGLRAFTPAEQKVVKAVSESFRTNGETDIYNTILNLGTGEAVVSFLDEKGIPSIAEKVNILPPKSFIGALSEAEIDNKVKESIFYSKYQNDVDPESAYEFLLRRGAEEQEALESAELEKQAAKEQAKADKEAEKAAAAKKTQAGRAAKTVGNAIAGTVGREIGKQFGKSFGSFGKTLGGNVGASLGRGLLSTIFKK